MDFLSFMQDNATPNAKSFMLDAIQIGADDKGILQLGKELTAKEWESHEQQE